MAKNKYTIGTDIELTATLNINGTPLDVSSGVVEARLVKTGGTDLATGTAKTVCVQNTSTGSVTAVWTHGQTANITPGVYDVEFLYLVSGKVYGFERVQVSLMARAAT